MWLVEGFESSGCQAKTLHALQPYSHVAWFAMEYSADASLEPRDASYVPPPLSELRVKLLKPEHHAEPAGAASRCSAVQGTVVK